MHLSVQVDVPIIEAEVGEMAPALQGAMIADGLTNAPLAFAEFSQYGGDESVRDQALGTDKHEEDPVFFPDNADVTNDSTEEADPTRVDAKVKPPRVNSARPQRERTRQEWVDHCVTHYP